MVADDPFNEPPSGAARESAIPTVLVTNGADITTSYKPDNLPTTPPRALVSGTTGTKTPKRVQWTQDHVINFDPLDATSTDKSLNHSNLSEVNDALERIRHLRSNLSRSSVPSPASHDDYRHCHDPLRHLIHNHDDYGYGHDHDPEHRSEERKYEAEHDDVKKHMGQYVAPNETDGLPSLPPSEEKEERAETHVRSHMTKWRMLRHRIRRSSLRQGPSENDELQCDQYERWRSSDESTAVEPVSDNPPGKSNRQAPGSVLSSILALNARYHDSGSSSHATSPESTPALGDDSDHDSNPSRRASRQVNQSSTASQAESPGFKGKVQRSARTLISDRPKAARSDAGVIGALVGATGGLAAYAAPSATTLVPATKRAGYRLARYSLPGTPQEPSPASTPHGSRPSSVFSGYKEPRSSRNSEDLDMAEKEGTRRDSEARRQRKRRRMAKKRRKKQEVFIVQHVAEILARQKFLLKLARALMMFGSPTHRLETQIEATARVLEMHVQVVHLPSTMLISFGDNATHTSETKFLKQSMRLDLGKLHAMHRVYWNVVHDRCRVEDASTDLDTLMLSRPAYARWQIVIISMMCSAFIAVPAFNASFIDALTCAALGGILALVQLLADVNDMFSNVFEIVVATLISFIAAVLSDTNKFCYTALVTGGVVLILPGLIVLTGALELASRNITAGSVRIGYAVIYSLFLGFGISMGAELYFRIRHRGVKNSADYTCKATHVAGQPWYMSQPNRYWDVLCVPMYALCLSLRNGQPLLRRETLVMMLVASAGWSANRFTGPVFEHRADITSAIGSFCVGILGNLYGRFNHGASFPVMVTGILVQLPSGLSQGGLFSFAAAGQAISESDGTTGTTTAQYSQGFQVSEQLVSVAIGLTVGLFVAAVVTHPLGGGRRRGWGIFSF